MAIEAPDQDVNNVVPDIEDSGRHTLPHQIDPSWASMKRKFVQHFFFAQANLGRCIKRIYELAWEQFSDLPRGHHKNNSMHKLASKTMLEILPDRLMKHIEAKLGTVATTPDFFDVIGQVSVAGNSKSFKM